MELCSVELLSLVGVISAVVHIIVRGLIQTFPKQNQLLLNLMLLVNILLIVYFGWCLYKNENEKKIN